MKPILKIFDGKIYLENDTKVKDMIIPGGYKVLPKLILTRTLDKLNEIDITGELTCEITTEGDEKFTLNVTNPYIKYNNVKEPVVTTSISDTIYSPLTYLTRKSRELYSHTKEILQDLESIKEEDLYSDKDRKLLELLNSDKEKLLEILRLSASLSVGSDYIDKINAMNKTEVKE